MSSLSQPITKRNERIEGDWDKKSAKEEGRRKKEEGVTVEVGAVGEGEGEGRRMKQSSL